MATAAPAGAVLRQGRVRHLQRRSGALGKGRRPRLSVQVAPTQHPVHTFLAQTDLLFSASSLYFGPHPPKKQENPQPLDPRVPPENLP